MRAIEAKLLMFIHNNKQFQVPIYQRRYDWGEDECKKLWDAVLDAGADKSIPSYFLGSIVYIKEDNDHASSLIEKYYLIDGQQRLATVSLLLAALGEAIENEKTVEIGINKTDLQYLYLFNRGVPDDNYRYKYLLTEPDKETLNRLLDDRTLPTNPSDRLLENYRFFKEKLQPQNLEAVYKGIGKLQIVDVLLERDKKDDPQLIFETINSTGTQLTEADLIRNYIFMGQTTDFQQTLCEEYWRPMEQQFGEDYADPLCQFIRDYIMLKTQKEVPEDDVYEEFKRQVSNKDKDTLEEFVKEIHRYSEYYVRFVPLKEENRIKEKDPELRELFKGFNAFQVTTVFPLMLSLYVDYMGGLLQKTEFIEVLQLIENYIVRRVICVRSGTKHARKVFLSLISDIGKSDYIENLKKAFAKLTSQARYYSDAEFKEDFCTSKIYSQRGCHYLLHRLENYEHPKEPILLEDYTKERIMPNTMTEDWKEELGENWEGVHQKHLNTIGNLTLTGQNSKLSNRPFKEKKEILRDSPLSLNRDIAQIERWDETTMRNRANDLSEKALKIWPDHGVSQVMQQEQKEDRTEADYPQLTGEMMKLYQRLENRIWELEGFVSQSFAQRYIAFKVNEINFVIIEPQVNRLRLSLKIPYSELVDPAHLSTGEKNTGKSGFSLGSEVLLSSAGRISYVMGLVIQAFEKQKAGKD